MRTIGKAERNEGVCYQFPAVLLAFLSNPLCPPLHDEGHPAFAEASVLWHCIVSDDGFVVSSGCWWCQANGRLAAGECMLFSPFSAWFNFKSGLGAVVESQARKRSFFLTTVSLLQHQ